MFDAQYGIRPPKTGSIISFPRFREFEETRSHNGGGGTPHRVAPQRKISPITITTFATLLCVCPSAGRPVVGRSVVRPNRIILCLSHDSCRSTPQRSERRVYRSVKCKLPGNVNKTFNVVGSLLSRMRPLVANRHDSVSLNWEQSIRRKTVIRFDYLFWERERDIFYTCIKVIHIYMKCYLNLQTVFINILPPKFYL